MTHCWRRYYERSGVKGQSDPVPEAGLKKS
jgi:hypothetical protein